MRRLPRALLGAVTALSFLFGPTAAAQDDGVGNGAVLLILDASGSMNRIDDRGVVLIDGARESLTELVGVLPAGALVGLRVYGHRVPNDDRVNGCVDTELIVPVGPLERAAMTDAINGVGARGFTPIGLSLQEAATDLPDGRGTIVLVSDGEDTCAPPDPCDVARDLVASGLDVRVHTVGFFLEGDAAARGQLQCIADEGGGTYREVDAAPVLAAELGSIVRSALPEMGRVHLPIPGGLEITTAQPLPLNPVPTGDFVTAEGAFVSPMQSGETRWYSVELAEGQGLMVGGGELDFGLEPLPDEAIEIVILAPDLEDARRVAPRRGVNEVPLSDFERVPDTGLLGASTSTDFHPWPKLEASEIRLLEYQGYDEEIYHEEALTRGLVPREAVAPAGTYYIGIAWHSDRQPVEKGVDFGVSVVAVAPRVGFDHVRLGWPEEARWAPLIDVPPFVFAGDQLPPGEYPHRRGFYVGEISSGETRWYRQIVEHDEAVAVEATLVRSDGQQLNAGEFSVEIYDPADSAIGRDYLSAMRAPVNDESPNPGVGATMAWSGEGDVPVGIEGDVRVAITWTSPSVESGEVRLIVDIVERYPEGVRAPGEPFITGAAADEPATNGAASDDGHAAAPGGEQDSLSGPEWVVIGLGLAVGAAALTSVLAGARRRTARAGRPPA